MAGYAGHIPGVSEAFGKSYGRATKEVFPMKMNLPLIHSPDQCLSCRCYVPGLIAWWREIAQRRHMLVQAA